MFIQTTKDLIENSNANRPQTEKKGELFLKLNNGQEVFIMALIPSTEFVSYYKHSQKVAGKWVVVPCVGDGCPACQNGIKRSLRTLIPMIVADDIKGTNARLQIFDASVNDMKEVFLNETEYGNLHEMVWKFKRVGEGTDTSYKLFPQMKADPKAYRSQNRDNKTPDWSKVVKVYSKEEMAQKLGLAYAKEMIGSVPVMTSPALEESKKNLEKTVQQFEEVFGNDDPFGIVNPTEINDDDIPF